MSQGACAEKAVASAVTSRITTPPASRCQSSFRLRMFEEAMSSSLPPSVRLALLAGWAPGAVIASVVPGRRAVALGHPMRVARIQLPISTVGLSALTTKRSAHVLALVYTMRPATLYMIRESAAATDTDGALPPFVVMAP